MDRSDRPTAPRAGYRSLQAGDGGSRRSGIPSRPGLGWLPSPRPWTGSVPGGKPSVDPRSGITRRHHLDRSLLQKALKAAVRRTGYFAHAAPLLRNASPRGCSRGPHGHGPLRPADPPARRRVPLPTDRGRRLKAIRDPLPHGVPLSPLFSMTSGIFPNPASGARWQLIAPLAHVHRWPSTYYSECSADSRGSAQSSSKMRPTLQY